MNLIVPTTLTNARAIAHSDDSGIELPTQLTTNTPED